MTPTERRNRSEELAVAALDVFSEKGYGDASMRDIADRVGLLKGSIYHYTDSKEALLARIFEQATDRTFAILDGIDRSEQPAIDRFAAFVEGWSRWYLENIKVIRVYLQEWKHLSGERLRRAVATRCEAYGRVARLLEEAKEEGAAAADLDCRHAALLILSAINGLPGWYRPGQSEPPELVAGTYADLLVGMVTHSGEAATVPGPDRAALEAMIAELPTRAGGDHKGRGEMVLRAAIEVFHERGYAGASMREIAERSGMNKGSLYHYIDSKEGLLAEIFAASTERTFALLAEIEAMPGPALARLGAFVDCWSRWYLLNLKVITVYIDDWKHLSGERLRRAVATRREAYERVVRLLEQAREEGAAADLDCRYASLLILSAINGLPGWYRPGQSEPPELVAGTYSDLLVGMVSNPKPKEN